VPFRMPTKVAPVPEDAPPGDRGSARAARAALPPRAKPKGGRAAAAQADQWVQDRATGSGARASVEPGAAADSPVAVRGWTIDLSAERDATEVAALAFLVPPMLGWFWLFNIASRYFTSGVR
jgi:hypothetical protein